ncbi:peptidoglycan binding domain-containing protein, partial [Streptomyces montanisoli]
SSTDLETAPGAGETGSGQDASPFGDPGHQDPYQDGANQGGANQADPSQPDAYQSDYQADAYRADAYRSDAYQDGAPHTGGPGTPPFGVPGTAGPGPDDRPNGPTAGPATGGSTLGSMPAGPGHTPPFGTPEVPEFGGTPAHGTPAHGTPAHGTPEVPEFGGQRPGAAGTPPRLSDDTAILTPQQLAPEPGTPAAGHVSGSTLSSGAPITPSDQRTAPFPGSGTQGGQGARPRPDLTPRLDDRPAPGQGPGPGSAGPGGPAAAARPAAAAAPAAPAKPAAKKKGRSKPVLGVVALLVIAGGLYGAGLVMSHTDVPKGTTVLGVDIGGSTKDQAVDTLEKRLGKRATLPLKLTVDGKSSTLSPENAGLTLDDQATVQAAAGPDYNPVDVVGSLFGRQRPIDPVMPVDEEKLTAALNGIAGSLGSEREGTITFDTGKPVAVPGKAGTGLDVARAKQSVRDAYRNQVETGSSVSVTLPTVEQQPTISQADIQQAMKDFAKPAMSDLVTIKAPSGASIQFGQISLPKILSMKAVDGKLVDSYDLKALKNAYGSAFDGVKVKRADGSSTAVTPQDIADQLRVALRGKTSAERTREIGSPTKGLTG